MPNIRDVAERAGVSRTTVSLVLNGRGDAHGIASPTQQRVHQAASALRYRPNYHGRTFLRGRSDALGWCSVDGGNAGFFWWPLFAGATAGAARHGVDVITVSARDDESAAARGRRFLHERRIDALLVPGHLAHQLEGDLAGERIVVVMPWQRSDLPWVGLDPRPGIDEAVARAAALGHRRLAYLGLDDPNRTGAERAAAYRDAAAAAGLGFTALALPHPCLHHTYSVDQSLESIVAATAPRLDELGPATVIACYNDLLALAVVQVLTARGRRVPEDVSVIGFDDIGAAFALPRLTTISHALPELGAAAVELALAGTGGHRLVPASFVAGASLGPARPHPEHP
jgi:LacI family transcriptional regulator